MKKWLPAIIGLCAVLAVILIYRDTVTLWHNQYDDSLITYRYAANLANGHGLVFNVGEKTDAASSFLFAVFLAAVYRIGWHDMEMVSFLLNMLAVGTIAAFVYLCAFRLSRNRWGSAALALIASLHGFTSGWSVLGMETCAFAALLCALAWAMIERRDRLSLALVVAVVLMRPEGVIVVPFWWWATGRKVRDGALVAGVLALFYGFKWLYYGSPLGALQAKHVLLYYQSDPVDILRIWKHFAVAAPVIAIAGVIMDKRVRWLGAFILLFGIVCLFGVKSDWVRYTVPLFPLMLIAGAPAFRRWQFIPLVCAVLLFQGFHSVRWMHYQAARLAPVQEVRARVGDWLQANADHSRPVISGDIGAIGYHAMDVPFIDLIGLTSYAVLDAYKRGENCDAVIRAANPQYVADTFEIKDGALLYTHGNGKFVRNGKPCTNRAMKVIWGQQVGKELAIVIGEIQ